MFVWFENLRPSQWYESYQRDERNEKIWIYQWKDVSGNEMKKQSTQAQQALVL